MEDRRTKLIANGWQQGIILPALDLSDVSVPTGSDVFLMAVTQTCDLLQADFEKEPLATFLVVRPASSQKPETANGHHPRILQFPDTSGTLFEAWAWEQVSVPHEALLEVDGTSGLRISEKTRRIVVNWLAKRFDRIAFPDGFVARLDHTKRKTKKALKRHHHLFSEILLSVTPFRELEEGENYRVICVLLMEEELYAVEKSRTDAEDFAKEFKKLILAAGLEMLGCDVVRETELSVAELRELKRLDYDFLSFRDEDDSD